MWLVIFKLGRLSSLCETTIRREEVHAENLRTLVEDVARDMERKDEARIVESSEDSVTLRMPLTMKSWGEKLLLNIEEDSIRVVSKSAMPFTVADWGKNQENIERVRYSINGLNGR